MPRPPPRPPLPRTPLPLPESRIGSGAIISGVGKGAGGDEIKLFCGSGGGAIEGDKVAGGAEAAGAADAGLMIAGEDVANVNGLGLSTDGVAVGKESAPIAANGPLSAAAAPAPPPSIAAAAMAFGESGNIGVRVSPMPKTSPGP